MRIGIIGGGASGMTAAIAAKRADKDADVCVLEQKDILGKKILSTGNGRCNLTNEVMNTDCFRSEQITVVGKVLEQFRTEQTVRFFSSLGVMIKSRNGYSYPRSNQAQSVVEALSEEIRHLGVRVYNNTYVTEIVSVKKGFRISCKEQKFFVDKLILSTGGRAASVLGSDGSGYTLAKSMGHTLIPVVPALVQLKAVHHPFAGASGVRTDASVTALVDGRKVVSDTGELQITAYGVSGIPVFQISRYIAKAVYEKRKAQVEIDFVPEMEERAWCDFLVCKANRQSHLNMGSFLESIFPKKMIGILLKLSGIDQRLLVKDSRQDQLLVLARKCKHTVIDIADTNGFENAQVCAGGVALSEIDPKTMESCSEKGLYITGELLDVDGICGGYNLQWAWATGYLAGKSAACSTQ